MAFGICFQNPEDLRIFAGETIIVLQKHEHGWWLGSIDRDGDVVKGYFPKNYVKEKPTVAAAPPPPPRPTSLPRPPTSADDSVSQLAGNVSSMSVTPTDTKKTVATRGFSLKSLPAFDDLMSKGYAVERTTPGVTGALPQRGEEVVLQCTALTWDGALGGAKEYASGTLRFVVGKGVVVPGLESAVQTIPIGQGATVTCSPAMAYGNAGFPPSVPPNSFVVFQVTVVSSSPVSDPDARVEGPSQLFVADLPAHRRLSVHAMRERIVLEPSTAPPTDSTPTNADESG